MVIVRRTTLQIDQDVLDAAKEIAQRTRSTAGQVLSDLARKALTDPNPSPDPLPIILNGFEILPAGDRIVSPDLVERLLEESESQ